MNRHGARRRRRAQRTYRLLVLLYPAAHRRAFGEEMVQTFGDHYRDAVQERGGSRLRFWMAALADAGASLLTEHAAELRARGRRRAAMSHRRRCRDAAGAGGVTGGPGGGKTRRRRQRRRLRYRPSVGRRVRVVVRTRRHQLLYRGRIAVLAVTLPAIGAALGTGVVAGHFGMSLLVTGLLVTAWLGYAIRLARRVPAGPHGDGPAPPGGAGVREPRRPRPMSPAGAAARPMPDQDRPGPAAALI
jgi:hypothetical protein